MVVQPDLEIVGPGGSVLASVRQSVTLTHMFSPLVTSDGGQYTCTATLNIPEAAITDLQGSAVEIITVASELTTGAVTFYYVYIPCLFKNIIYKSLIYGIPYTYALMNAYSIIS